VVGEMVEKDSSKDLLAFRRRSSINILRRRNQNRVQEMTNEEEMGCLDALFMESVIYVLTASKGHEPKVFEAFKKKLVELLEKAGLNNNHFAFGFLELSTANHYFDVSDLKWKSFADMD